MGLVIAGPTGSGKTELAAALARRLGGEIVSADSRQVYRGLDAATGKARIPGVVQHLLDVADPQEKFDAGRFRAEAAKVVEDIRARGRRPIVAGGTGLYVKAFLEGLSELPKRDDAVRARLAALSESELRAKLSPEVGASIPKGNRQRLIRAVEVLELTGRQISEFWDKREGKAPGEWLALRIDWPADVLRDRLTERCKQMWPALLEEVRELKGRYSGKEPGFESLGYREALAVLEGGLEEAAGLETFIKSTLAYAKRQRTWFRTQLKAVSIEGGPIEEMARRAERAIEEARG